MHVHALYLYPVKSLAGIEVDSFRLDDFGPEGDRRWMIVDSEGCFVTQRSVPGLARVQAAIAGSGVEVTIPGEGAFVLQATDEVVQVQVWKDRVRARVGDAAASTALSRYCGADYRFVYMPEDSFRRVDPSRVAAQRRVSFADGFPLLVTNLASLDELNGRLAAPVSMRRFRPNIVLEGAPAWSEDTWKVLQVNQRRLALVKPCSRCVMTTVDPSTGLKDEQVQPLRTLSTYRRTADGVIFGMNAVHDGPGVVRVGDSVNVLEREKS